MLKYLIPSLLLVIITACDDTSDIFFEDNVKPDLQVKTQNDIYYSTDIKDSIKIGNSTSYILDYKYSDDQLEPLELGYEFLSGAGVVQYNSDKTIMLQLKDGHNILNLIATDCYGEKSIVNVDLFTFTNLKPVAVFDHTYNNQVLYIDASLSYDTDANFGGSIIQYEFTIGSLVFKHDKPIITQTTNFTYTTQVKVRVQDDYGTWSDYAIETIYIN